MMNRTRIHPIALVVPLGSLLIAGCLVGQQIQRRDSLRRQLATAERDLASLMGGRTVGGAHIAGRTPDAHASH